LRVQNQTRSWRAIVVNGGGNVISTTLAGGAFYLLRGDAYLWNHGILTLAAFPAVATMAVCYHVVDTAVVVGAITLSSRDKPWPVFSAILRDASLPEMSLIFVGVVFAVLWHFSPVLSLLIIVPVGFSFRAFESVARLRKETVEAVLKMAESIDYRDTGTSEHSQRIADLTRRLAQELSLTPEHVDDIVLASRVHDLGKIGISNDILLKQGSLTADERETIEEHTIIGASILSSYSAFQNSVQIVKSHHERWDGHGYPERLRGEEIPVGSRIISVVDAFDAMIADRPYRHGMPVHEAVERLIAGIGTQFDPKLCATFIHVLIEDGTYVPREAAPDLRLVPSPASYA
jgi:putative nucleotidyltransferase with HDIG domain